MLIIWSDNALTEHPILRSVLTDGFQEPRSSIDNSVSNIDKYLTPDKTYHVVDADSSQVLAIHDVSQGETLLSKVRRHRKIPTITI